MSNYIPGGQKKIKIFKKREKELTHALKNDFSKEKIIRAAESLRESKIQSIWAMRSQTKLSAEENLAKRRSLVEKWKSYTIDEIIEAYSKSLPNK